MRHRKYGWVDNMWAKEMRAKSKFADFVASGYPPKAVWRSFSPSLSADTGWMVCVSEAKATFEKGGRDGNINSLPDEKAGEAAVMASVGAFPGGYREIEIRQSGSIFKAMLRGDQRLVVHLLRWTIGTMVTLEIASKKVSPKRLVDPARGEMYVAAESKETGDVLISDRGAGCRMVFPFGTLTHQLLLIKEAMGAEGDPLPGLTAILEGIGLDPGDALDSIRMGLIV